MPPLTQENITALGDEVYKGKTFFLGRAIADDAPSLRFLKFCEENPEYRQEFLDVCNYIRNHRLQMYPYEWFDTYPTEHFEVFYDEKHQLKYTIYNGKRIYYPVDFSDRKIEDSINFFRKEQSGNSPHLYIPNEDHAIKNGGVVLDCGAAEANFSLDVIEKCRKVYIFEGDKKWIRPLQATFCDYPEKVRIIDKYLSSYSGMEVVTIDEIVEEEIDFIKMDIEGFELKALCGCVHHLKEDRDLKMSICAYHNHEDAYAIPIFLEKYGFSTSFSQGGVFRTDGSIYADRVPDFRKGMIYARRSQKG